MMYHNKVAAAIKVGGKVLRETNGTVSLPFGSEYSVLVKNLHAVRLQVKVSVDGKDATEGTWLVIPPNSSVELERFIRNGNLSSGNRFKFIERTAAIEEHRGIEVDDGLVRIEYRAEKVVPKPVHVPVVYDYPYYYYWPYYWPHVPPRPSYPPYYYSGLSGGIGSADSNSNGIFYTSNASGPVGATSATGGVRGSRARLSGENRVAAMNYSNEAGITVPGSESSQQFQAVSGFQTVENAEVIVLKLCGTVAGKPVAAPVTVVSKLKCPTCGRVNKSASRFCSDCGTSLRLIS